MKRSGTDELCSASETALRFLALCARGLESREAGYCVGNLRDKDVVYTNGKLFRVKPSGSLAQLFAVKQSFQHRRSQHDHACLTFGVPMPVCVGLCTAWGGDAVAVLLTEALHCTVRLCNQIGVPRYDLSPYEILYDEVSIRIEIHDAAS